MKITGISIIIILIFMAYCQKDPDAIDPETLNTWTIYNTSNGLAENYILSLFEDSQGNIWAGTFSGGVCKFDGKQWTNYNTDDGLIDITVLTITEDIAGNIWFGTFGGISVFDGSTWVNYPTMGGYEYSAMALHSDRSGNMWIGTDNMGILRFDGQSLTQRFDTLCEDCNFIQAIAETGSGDIWFGTQGGVVKFDGWRYNTFNTSDGLASNNIKSVFEDSWGDIWLGTGDSKFFIKYDGSRFYSIDAFNDMTVNAAYAIAE
ncbi:MAG: hypothetical protein JSV22_04095, partial [Bacteroidales bacterium]